MTGIIQFAAILSVVARFDMGTAGWYSCRMELSTALSEKAVPARALREFTFYLPMDAKLKSLEVAMDSDATIEPPSPFKINKPIVFYGTSFIQGGCASRASSP
jgi:hypothetical protein